MQLSNIEIDEVYGLQINMGYRSTTNVIVTFIDQNNITHKVNFEFVVSEEKPTWFRVRHKDDGKLLYAISSDYSEMR